MSSPACDKRPTADEFPQGGPFEELVAPSEGDGHAGTAARISRSAQSRPRVPTSGTARYAQFRKLRNIARSAPRLRPVKVESKCRRANVGLTSQLFSMEQPEETSHRRRHPRFHCSSRTCKRATGGVGKPAEEVSICLLSLDGVPAFRSVLG